MKKLLMALATVQTVIATTPIAQAESYHSQYIGHKSGAMTEIVHDEKHMTVEYWFYDAAGNLTGGHTVNRDRFGDRIDRAASNAPKDEAGRQG